MPGAVVAAFGKAAVQRDAAHHVRGDHVTGGHAENALPQSATALVNCRLLPVDKPEEIRADAGPGACRPEDSRSR